MVPEKINTGNSNYTLNIFRLVRLLQKKEVSYHDLPEKMKPEVKEITKEDCYFCVVKIIRNIQW